jgi:hypothetical protein
MNNPEIIAAEWEEVFPFEQEYLSWIESIESDYRAELEHRNGILTNSKSQFFFDSDE